MIAFVNNAIPAPVPIDLVLYIPCVSAFSDGRLIAQHSDFTLVTDSSPAKPGEILVMYLTSMGATGTAVKSGAISPLSQVLVKPIVTVDGQIAEIFYAGLTPGGIGLYQISFRVPEKVRIG